MDVAFRRAVGEARRQRDLYFAGLLPEDRINQAFGAARGLWQGWVYTPAATVWVFLSQCFSADHSCRDAVARLIGWRLVQGLSPCSAETGAYCWARDALPEKACAHLAHDAGLRTDDEAPAEWRWRGRRVLDVDGSTITMADTPENQAEYPQPSSQRPGCGFPIARILVVFSLATGTVLHAAIGKYQGKQTGENSLFRALHENVLREGDVVLADRYFSGWFDIALLKQRGVDCVTRKHQLRATDFRTGKRLGPNDHLVSWPKPGRPAWMSREQYASLPDELTVREVRVFVRQKFRTKELIVVTTLLDAEEYTTGEIADLYRRRWDAELNLRSMKIVMQMDHLRCKAPHRVRNEFYMHLLAYNLIRQVMAAAASRAGTEPRTVSFKGTLQTVNNLLPLLDTNVSTDDWCDAVLDAVATHVVGDRPDRYEPRVRKRRPKNYKLMRKPRKEYRKRAA